jgi:hypothetical protein
MPTKIVTPPNDDEGRHFTDWQEALARTRAIAAEIRNRRGDEPLTPTPEEVIRQIREERNAYKLFEEK